MKTRHAASCFPYLCPGDQILQILSVLNHSRNRYGDEKQEPACREGGHWEVCWQAPSAAPMLPSARLNDPKSTSQLLSAKHPVPGKNSSPLLFLSSWGISGGKSIILLCPEMENQRIKALQQFSWRPRKEPQLQNTAEKHRTLRLHPGPKPSHTPAHQAQRKAPKASTNLVCSKLSETVNRQKKKKKE